MSHSIIRRPGPVGRVLLLVSLLVASATLPLQAQSIFMKLGGGFASQPGAAGHIGTARLGFGYEYELSQTLTFAPSIGLTGRGWKVSDLETPDLLFDEKGNMLDADGNITTDPALQGQRYTEKLGPDGKPLLGPDGKPIKDQPMYSMMHRTYTMNYIQLDLPLVYYHCLAERSYLSLTAGPWIAVGVAGRRTTEGDGRVDNPLKPRYTDNVFSLEGARRFDCGLKAGVGYQFPSSLTINLEGEFGLLKTNSVTGASALDDPFAFRAGRNAALFVTLSYRLNKSKWKAED